MFRFAHKRVENAGLYDVNVCFEPAYLLSPGNRKSRKVCR